MPDSSVAPLNTQHIVVMGVSGSGKTTVGELLARRLSARFIEGDELHPQSNVEKMAAGIPLDDADRKPWLEMIGRTLAEAKNEAVVIACSALKKSYRDVIRSHDPTAQFVLLDGPEKLIRERLQGRRGHFMPPSLLQSQFDTLEPLAADEAGFVLDIAATPEEIVRQTAVRLGQAKAKTGN